MELGQGVWTFALGVVCVQFNSTFGVSVLKIMAILSVKLSSSTNTACKTTHEEEAGETSRDESWR